MIELRRPLSKLAAVLLVLLYILAHLLAAAGPIGFGVSAGGYPLNRWGIYGYAAAAIVAPVLGLSQLWRREEDPSPLQLTLPPLLALWVASLYFTTAILWAEFAPYVDVDGLFAALNLAFALAGLATVALLAGYLWWQGRALAAYARVLFAPGQPSRLSSQ